MQKLLSEPWSFEFFQAVRLITNQAVLQAKQRADVDWNPEDARFIFVGQDKPGCEALRFRAKPSLAFASAPVAGLKLAPASPSGAGDAASAPDALRLPVEMTVTFMGLFGGQGVLPTHYTSLIIERLTKKDSSMAEFFDLFNHRLLSLFYRAWEKYRVAPALEHAALAGDHEDQLTQALFALVGMSGSALRNHLGVDDSTLLYYGGLFSHKPRSAIALQQLLIEFLGIPVQVQQFTGQWLPLDEADWSRCPSVEDENDACHNQLGESLIIGDRVWDVQGSFRLRLGPLDFSQYVRFLPGGDQVPRLSHLTRMFVGGEFKFDYVPVLRADKIPQCKLGSEEQVGPMLGRTAWLRPEQIPSSHLDFDGAVFDSIDD